MSELISVGILASIALWGYGCHAAGNARIRKAAPPKPHARHPIVAAMLLLTTAAIHFAKAQTPQSQTTIAMPIAASSATVVPMLVRYDGAAIQSDGRPKTGATPVTFLVYKEDQGGEALWTETQSVVFDLNGKYEVYLGSTRSSGLPADLFGSGDARWLEVQVAGEPARPRTLIVSVPYAIHAADAATLGGLPVSAFMRTTASSGTSIAAPDVTVAATSSSVTTTGGRSGLVPVFTGASSIGNSIIYANSTSVGIGLEPSIYGVLDVGGQAIFRGAVSVARTANATAAAGANSYPFLFGFQYYNSAAKFVYNPYFSFQAEVTGNNTANPAGTMNLLYYNGIGGKPTETGLYFNHDGTIHFALGQTFPFTSSTGNGLTGVSSSGIGVQGTSTAGTGVQGVSSSSYGVEGTSTTGPGVLGYTAGNTPNTGGVVGQAGQTSGFGGIAGVWGDAFSHVGVLGTSYQYSGVQGISYVGPGLQGQSTTNVGVEGTSETGPGATGTSNVGDGVQGTTQGISDFTAGVMGSAGTRTSFGGIAGVWGDAATHVGVFGSSNQYAGVQGLSTQGQGVQGQSTLNSGVQGTSISGTGVAGTSTTANGLLGYTAGGTNNTGGVVGQAGGTSGLTGIAGVWGDTSTHVGVYGTSTQAEGVLGVSVKGSGVYGVSNDTNASDDVAGVYGYASGALPAVKGNNAGAGPAAVFISNSPTVATVTAYNNGTSSGTATAVLGVGSSEGGIGVEGETIGGIGVLGEVGLSVPGNRLSGYAGNVAVWGDATTLAGIGVIGSTSNDNAAYFTNNSSNASTIYARNYGSGSTGDDVTLFGALEAATPNGTCGVGGNGDLTCTGQVKTLATTGNGVRMVETYSMQSPENWMEDFGSGRLQNGAATISIDAAFAETVSGSVDYHVFLTPRGDSKGLYVKNTTAASFEVHESGGGTSTLAFDYRIVAKRRGFEAQRMVDVTEAMKSVKSRNDLQAARFKKAAK